MNYQHRVSKLQKKIQKLNIEAILISNPANRSYLSGYSDGDHGIGESSGFLLVPAKGEVFLLTDSRFELQAKLEVPWAKVHLYQKGLNSLLKKLLPKIGVKNLGFESDYMLYDFFLELTKTLATKKIKACPTTGIVAKMRIVKDPDEIDLIRQSVLLNELVFTKSRKEITTETTELELAIAIETYMRKHGASSPSFDTIVASGNNSALPHAVPSKTKIKPNKSLTVDMGLVLNGYCSDMTRTFVPNNPSKKYLKIHRIVRQAQLAGMAAITDGVTGAEVDSIARDVINSAGYGKYFGHGLGHGVGIEVHEAPRLSPMGENKLKSGMIVTVEPGIYIPGWGGIRLENMVVVRKDGHENLNKDKFYLDI
ncbi:MAG: Xaa-Pro peptidase family protein [Desulfotalea sp.]